jgi:hypothetical protein
MVAGATLVTVISVWGSDWVVTRLTPLIPTGDVSVMTGANENEAGVPAAMPGTVEAVVEGPLPVPLDSLPLLLPDDGDDGLLTEI